MGQDKDRLGPFFLALAKPTAPHNLYTNLLFTVMSITASLDLSRASLHLPPHAASTPLRTQPPRPSRLPPLPPHAATGPLILSRQSNPKPSLLPAAAYVPPGPHCKSHPPPLPLP
jgi:hypothetical protein